jgi:hypothetical protein
MIKEEAKTPLWNSKHLGKFHDDSCLLEDVRCVVDGYSSCCCMCEYVTHVERNIWIYSVIKVKLFQLQTHIHRKGFVRLRPRSMAQRSSRTPLSCMLLFTSSLWQIFVNRLTMSILFPSTYFLWCLYMFSSSFPFFIFRRFPSAAARQFSHTLDSLQKKVRPLQVHETSMGPTRRWVCRLIFGFDWGCRLYSWRRGAMFQVWSKLVLRLRTITELDLNDEKHSHNLD